MNTPSHTKRRRRWPFVALALAVIAMLGATGIYLAVNGFRANVLTPRPDWMPPAQTFLASSMAWQPVPGWRVGTSTLGLPEGSKIASNMDVTWSSPFVGAIDDRAFFLAGSPIAPGSAQAQWWLVGVSASSGRVLFPPARLGVAASGPECVLNGPDLVLCLIDEADGYVLIGGIAWVVDTHTGVVRYSGRTPVAVIGGDYMLGHVGQYAIATSPDRGVSGIGPSAELTWFVPGDGSPLLDIADDGTTAPPTQTSQGMGNHQGQPVDYGWDRTVTFSVVDGSVATLELGPDRVPGDAVVYPGGFAVRTEVAGRTKEVEFFDENGRHLRSAHIDGTFSGYRPGLPIVATESAAIVFSARGDELAKVPDYDDSDVFLMGSTLYAEDASTYESAWRPVNLKTGSIEGPVCHERLDGFFASDGTVGIFKQDNSQVGLIIKGVDLKTCEEAWSIRPPVRSFADVWRANETLIALSDDGTELSSLVSP